MRYALVLLLASAVLVACGGTQLPSVGQPTGTSGQVTPDKKKPPIRVSCSSLTLEVGDHAKCSVHERGYDGRFRASGYDSSVIAVRRGGEGGVRFFITALGGGSTNIVFGDRKGRTISLAVTVIAPTPTPTPTPTASPTPTPTPSPTATPTPG